MITRKKSWVERRKRSLKKSKKSKNTEKEEKKDVKNTQNEMLQRNDKKTNICFDFNQI